MDSNFISNKKGAMEMSMGTIVTIVLLMSVLVLGIVLVTKIFDSGTNAIDQVDTKVQNEISKLFADEGKPIVIYPTEREISLSQGEKGGFALSLQNIESGPLDLTYKVSVGSIPDSCTLNSEQAEKLIILGKTGSVKLLSGSKMLDPILVKFSIPPTTPLCLIRYNVDVYKENNPQNPYVNTVSVDLEIV